MLVRVRHRDGTVVGRLDSWDESGCVVDGVRYHGPLFIFVEQPLREVAA